MLRTQEEFGPLPRHYHCGRCGFACRHVEAGGIHWCPNCGDPQPSGDGVTYDFSHGCTKCGLAGHEPLPGFMELEMPGHPAVVFGLRPAFDVEQAIRRLQFPHPDPPDDP
jgi:hypothetical protein